MTLLNLLFAAADRAWQAFRQARTHATADALMMARQALEAYRADHPEEFRR